MIARLATYERKMFIDSGGTLYIWTTPESRANIQLDVELKQARIIAKTYGINKLKVQRS